MAALYCVLFAYVCKYPFKLAEFYSECGIATIKLKYKLLSRNLLLKTIKKKKSPSTVTNYDHACSVDVVLLFNLFIERCNSKLTLLCFAGSAGLGFLQFCNLNSFRTKFILGFSLFMGLSVPQYFNEYLLISGRGPVHTGAIWVFTFEQLYPYIWRNSCLYSFISSAYRFFFLAVQQHNASDFLISGNGGNNSCIFLGPHSQSEGQLNPTRQR